MTPSLVALDDASALKWKEWNRGESGEDAPQMYSTMDGNLTPTAPVYEDIRMDTPMNVNPEEPLGNLPTAVGGMEERDITQQTQDDVRGATSNVAPPTVDGPETRPKVINERAMQESSSRRNEVTRETSREDALAATRHFFHTVNE